jgi:radical SAM superfamily enzyme YgiQ (UPF0313 family)
MKVKMILPSLAEAGSPLWRPIKYSLFPPLGLATLAAFLDPADEIELTDQHVEELKLDDDPDLVVIQVYITNAYRAYQVADYYRSKGSYVVLGGLHVTALPEEAALHADTIFTGPGEDTFPRFLIDFRNRSPLRRYNSIVRNLSDLPAIRRDLIKRHLYLVPNSIVVSRGCPHQCDFCYKESFFKNGKSFYTRLVDDALMEIENLPGRHLYFLDDHLFGNQKFAESLFEGMKGMGRIFQAASTINSVLNKDLIEKASEAGLRSLFVGFETLTSENLKQSNKFQNLNIDYSKAIKILHDLGIMINGSFVFGMDSDDETVFSKTVEWAVKNAITTATFHILTPYPGTKLFEIMNQQGRIISHDWNLYDTRHVVFKSSKLTSDQLEKGYWQAYKDFYSLNNIFKASLNHDNFSHVIRHLAYTTGWKKMEPIWKIIVNSGILPGMRPILETILSRPGKNPKTSNNLAENTKEIQKLLSA